MATELVLDVHLLIERRDLGFSFVLDVLQQLAGALDIQPAKHGLGTSLDNRNVNQELTQIGNRLPDELDGWWREVMTNHTHLRFLPCLDPRPNQIQRQQRL